MQAIHANTTVRELLTTFPQAFGVLAAHGMCADCKEDPPAVPIRHFAQKHCGGNIDGLLAEIHAVIQPQDKCATEDGVHPPRGT
jgi:hypothetical protein